MRVMGRGGRMIWMVERRGVDWKVPVVEFYLVREPSRGWGGRRSELVVVEVRRKLRGRVRVAKWTRSRPR